MSSRAALLTAQGSSLENGAANYFVIHQDPRELAETTALTFLGFSMNCAKCHNHPMEKWTNNDYYGFANLFARVAFYKSGSAGMTRQPSSSPPADGELVQPLTGKPQPPRPPDGAADRGGRRPPWKPMVAWLTSPENHYFKRAIVNRVWANFFGVGLVENVDDIRVSNPSPNEALFTRAADFLVEQKFDLQALMRAILQSETYQRSSVPQPGNQADTRFYSHYYPRRMMAEVLHDAIAQVTAVPTVVQDAGRERRGRSRHGVPCRLARAATARREYRQLFHPCLWPGGARPDVRMRAHRVEPSVVQAMHLSNGDTINKKLADPQSAVAKALAANQPPEQAIDDAFLAASARARRPTCGVKQRLTTLSDGYAPDANEKRACLEDTYWRKGAAQQPGVFVQPLRNDCGGQTASAVDKTGARDASDGGCGGNKNAVIPRTLKTRA